MAQKPGIPKGTRDFDAMQIAKRNFIFDTVKKQFKVFGFQPIETPSFENYSTLMGKYGEEGDRLIFKILNSGDYLRKVDEALLQEKNSQKLTAKISEKALRYDLTVPFARYVVQHQNELTFPFKRYQIQPVWRADRPQKGRFREFYQCDADVVGSNSLWQDVEFALLYDKVFAALKVPVTIKINNRKILSGFSDLLQEKDKFTEFIVALDKLDKIGKDGVINEMKAKGISDTSIQNIMPIFDEAGNNNEKLALLNNLLSQSEEGQKGLEELRFVLDNIEAVGLQSATVSFDITLARGLNYYTGSIYEVSADNVQMGSIGGGGRYDDLTGIFGLKNMSGIGISFGLDRIYLVMEELGLFDEVQAPKPNVLFINFGQDEAFYSLKAVQQLRNAGISAELFPDSTKLKKQMNYANKRQIPFVAMAGSQEIAENVFTLKNMDTGEQQKLSVDEIISLLKR
jgi:histidyl-tRNA synthetase